MCVEIYFYDHLAAWKVSRVLIWKSWNKMLVWLLDIRCVEIYFCDHLAWWKMSNVSISRASKFFARIARYQKSVIPTLQGTFKIAKTEDSFTEGTCTISWKLVCNTLVDSKHRYVKFCFIELYHCINMILFHFLIIIGTQKICIFFVKNGSFGIKYDAISRAEKSPCISFTLEKFIQNKKSKKALIHHSVR